ncbi:uncharacterized protein LOC141641015 [Silene latifolia]|uniref:uncharacterized protein LOC141641015 n=1 Tax=Silene latifolia TaxID=37657 RepID=UPI003D7854D1
MEEVRDLTSLSYAELIGALMAHELVLEDDEADASNTKSMALQASAKEEEDVEIEDETINSSNSHNNQSGSRFQRLATEIEDPQVDIQLDDHVLDADGEIRPFSLSNGMESIAEEDSDDGSVWTEVSRSGSATSDRVSPLRLTSADTDAELEFWSTAVYCYVLGANPPFKIIDGFVKRVWGYTEYDRISFHSNGIFLVRFKTEEMKLRVLQSGPVFFDNKPVVVKEWTPSAKLVREAVDMVPIWIRFYGLPLKFWGNALLKIAGLVGKPIRSDSNTQLKTFIGHARVMVEVKMGGDLPDVIEFTDELDVTHRSWAFGSRLQKKNNGKDVKKVWVPKARAQQPVGVPAPPAPNPPVRPLVVQPRSQSVLPRGLVTPQPAAFTPFSPIRVLTKFSRQGGMSTGTGRRTFLEVLEHSVQYRKVVEEDMAETRVRSSAINKVHQSIGAQWTMVHNNDSHEGGRIWILWDSGNYAVDVLGSEAQVIHTKVTYLPTGVVWWMSMVYGFNRLADRAILWQSIKNMKCCINGPWVVMGDFNNVLAMNERIGSEVSAAEVREFQECVDVCGLNDIPAQGAFFTWTNKQEVGDLKFSRIDRALVTDEWLLHFPNTITMFHPEGLFDHCPCTMTLNPDVARNKTTFKYFNMWGKDPGFLKIIQDVWSIPLYGVKMFQLAKRLKLLKKPLKALNSEAYAGIETSSKVALLHLHRMQGQLQLDPTNLGFQQQVKEATDLYRDREGALRSFLSQKAKAQWLSEGDDNTHYFHSVIKARRMHNRILGIHDLEGNNHTTPSAIEGAFICYYKSLLGSNRRVTKVHKGTVQQGKLFFRDSFDVTGNDIIGAVQEFFSSGKMLKQINSTTLTLIPKKARPTTVADFRPIACCNVVYKIISKVICTRLATVLPDIISETQSAFIKGRDIVDNILICHDLVRLYKRKACSPRCMMKVDLKKAYDSIEWDFIKQMLQALNFPDQMIQWIMECVTTPWYTLSLNGSNFGYFQGRRGIRQGDPMSPLLFTICMEYLSRILAYVTNSMEFSYHPLCRAIRLNHLCFADDLLMFCRGDKTSIITILRAFATFSKASGLEINREKSDIYFNGMSSADVQYVLRISGFKEGQFPFRYLGIPISYKRMAVGDCSRLVEKIVLRIRGWGARKLSYAGRLVLVQAVLSQLHSFWTRIFIIPATVMDRINHICRNYLWCGSDEFHKTPPVAWDRVCTAKKYGGLGIVNGKNWNLAMLGKYVWWLAEKTDHLWIRWVNHMYIKGQNWLDYSPTVSSSWTWRKICQVKDILKPGYCQGKWSTNAGVYTVSVGYTWLQGNQVPVPWYPVIWNRLNLPKHSIIGWLAIQCRLLTKDRLLRFNIISDGYCDMCLDHLEDHNHLLYRCRFSACCWRLLADWLDINLPDTDILNWCIRWRCRSLMKKQIVITTIMAMIYQIWTAHNSCRVDSRMVHPKFAVQNVVAVVKSRGQAWKWTSKFQHLHWMPWM